MWDFKLWLCSASWLVGLTTTHQTLVCLAEYSNLPRWVANKLCLGSCVQISCGVRVTPCENRVTIVKKTQKKDAAWALAAGGSGFWSAETLRIAEWYDGDPSYPLPLFKANPVRQEVFKIRPYILKNCTYRLLILYWSRFSSWQLRGWEVGFRISMVMDVMMHGILSCNGSFPVVKLEHQPQLFGAPKKTNHQRWPKVTQNHLEASLREELDYINHLVTDCFLLSLHKHKTGSMYMSLVIFFL